MVQVVRTNVIHVADEVVISNAVPITDEVVVSDVIPIVDEVADRDGKVDVVDRGYDTLLVMIQRLWLLLRQSHLLALIEHS